MQARLALERGKKAFLVKSLVTDQQWAKDYVAKLGAIEVADVDEVICHLAEPAGAGAAGGRAAPATDLRVALSASRGPLRAAV